MICHMSEKIIQRHTEKWTEIQPDSPRYMGMLNQRDRETKNRHGFTDIHEERIQERENREIQEIVLHEKLWHVK